MDSFATNRDEKNAIRFKILMPGKNNTFFEWLEKFIFKSEFLFPGLEYSIVRFSEADHFNYNQAVENDLLFIDDWFLLDLNSDLHYTNKKIRLDFIIILNRGFSSEEAFKIKHNIEKNSLNLRGHISISRCTRDLISREVIGLIKEKLR